MEDVNIFIDKEEINKLFEEEKYKNCMDKKYFEYIVSNGKIDYIDKYLKHSKNKKLIEDMVFTDKVVKLVDRLFVKLEKKRYIGELKGSGIYNIEISEEIVKKYRNQILTNGIFCLIKLEENIDEKYPYYIEEIEVLEDTNVNLDEYIEHFSRRVKKYRQENNLNPSKFSSAVKKMKYDNISEIDLVLNTIGVSASELTFWEKILYLVRLIPLCEANYNLMELGGNGTGKTKTYSMFSPESEIVQEMTATGLIYNINTKTFGSLATKNVIVFDEVDKIKLDGDKEKVIPQLLNYMADGQTTNPREVISKASLIFSGNIDKIQERIEKNEKNIFDSSHKLENAAFLDRIHFFSPSLGLRRYNKNIYEKKGAKQAFRFDYFSKALSLLRDEDYSKILDENEYEIVNGSEREIRAIRKTVSGLIKLTHPDKQIDEFTLEAYIAIAIKGRGLINKFLNNKNKKNIGKIDIKVTKIPILYGVPIEKDKELIQVNESLKHLIYMNNSVEIEERYKIYKNYIEEYSMSYENYFEKYKRNSSMINKLFSKNRTFYRGKFYPNRQIIVFNNKDDKGKLVFLKIALDKMGIAKNEREEKIFKNIYKDKCEIDLLKKGRILIIIIENGFNKIKYRLTLDENILYNKKEINYDELFGDQSLDENDFTGRSLYEGTRGVEADLSNLYYIAEDKRLKLENGEYIKPKFVYSEDLDIYYYEDSNPKNREDKVVSEKMTYVEFKYFLANNGFIDL